MQVTADSPIVDVAHRHDRPGHHAAADRVAADRPLSYQSYLQLVPGVLPDDPQTAGNPASKSGINYSDIAGALGVSSDNFYYFNGINVTDPVTGTFGANLNTEIIQEQKVLTGGIPAEFVGTPGLLSSVITKSGTNRYRRLGQLLLPERQPGRREQELAAARSSDVRRRRHDRRADRPRTRPGSSAATAASSAKTT